MTQGNMKPPFSYYGGKQRLASKIVPYIPKHTVYAEPFCGGATVLFKKPWPEVTDAHHYREAINDLNSDLVTFFRVLRDDGERLAATLELTPYSYQEHQEGRTGEPGSDFEKAWRFFVEISMSFSGKVGGGWRNTRKGQNDPFSWAKKTTALWDYITRMRSVYVDTIDALEFIKRWDSPQTFFYIDPPYPGSEQGHYSGYTIQDFADLVEVLKTIKGSFLLANYPQPEVDTPWPFVDFDAVASAARHGHRNDKKRTERMWCHYTTHDQRPEIQRLFDSGKFDCFTGGAHKFDPPQRSLF
jgi:DNA adenine methylase